MIRIADQGHTYGLNGYIPGALFVRQEELVVVVLAVASPLSVISILVDEPGQVAQSELSH